jgi:hypothetical protein
LKAIVGPLYKAFARIPGLNISHCMASMERNIQNWEQMAASELGDSLRDPNKVAAVAAQLQLSSAGLNTTGHTHTHSHLHSHGHKHGQSHNQDHVVGGK